MIKRSEILINRVQWGNYLLTPDLKKARGYLELTETMALERFNSSSGAGFCCLGHGCKLFNIQREETISGLTVYGSVGEEYCAPKELIDLVGLWDNEGSSLTLMQAGVETIGPFLGKIYPSLASANDDRDFDVDISPAMIGTYILTVVKGGPNTPFKPLEDYPV
jgi:hypothetical protein